ncbi:MAG: prephenate dehydrogenase/arogenate dehydrogenase family protein [Xenococcaceae cyanobacterium MO_188.B32]|nr:prephenate dehydrogenase/arogenate dehydrogenase family protein [Xenococcaceae cyanobacterium MO_188.B32]
MKLPDGPKTPHFWQQIQWNTNPINPIECVVKVIRQAAQYISPTTALADIASIKTPIVKAMLEYHPGPVMGLHPMFGPGITSFLSQKIVVCPGRGDRCFQWLLDLIQSDGGKLIYATPEEHDRMMVDIQAIRNFTTLSMGAFFSEENINIRRSLDFASPLYRHTIAIVSRLFAQSAPLIVDIILATPERRQAISRLADNYSRLAQLVNNGDRDALLREFQISQSFFAQEIPCGFKESTHMINALSTLLAAQELEQKHQVSSTTNLPRKFTSKSSQKSLALSS